MMARHPKRRPDGRPPQAALARGDTLSEADLRLWQAVTRSATPLPGRPTTPPGRTDPSGSSAVSDPEPPPPRSARFFNAVASAPAVPAARPVRADGPASPPERRAGEGAGLDRRTHDRLRRGRLAIEGRLDLHGMTRERAHQALSVFLHRAHERGARCVLVVTGKGSSREGAGVLRRDVPHWLNQGGLRGMVLAFHHAQIRDGGEGALYVLLRRRRPGGPRRGGGEA